MFMGTFDLGDFSTLDPKQFASMVKNASTEELNAVMQGEHRTRILDEIFDRMPTLFRADKAGNTNAVVHWTVGDKPGGGADTYELVIADGACTRSPQPVHDPKLALSLGAADFLRVVTGNANPMMMFMTGKLKAKGDLGLAANIANLFDIPKG
jgi:putative sterol carrier protein